MASRLEPPFTAYRLSDARAPIYSSQGAILHGGRWNSPGLGVIYAAATFSTAMLEILVQANIGRAPLHMRFIRIEIPAGIWIEYFPEPQHAGWDSPDYRVSRGYGDRWINERRSALLIVPSLVARLDSNVVINPQHPQFARLRASAPEPVIWDARLFALGE